MLKVGIVGLPNVGKSTLFNAVLKREQALSANYPFATIDPNIGVVDVFDERLKKLAEIVLKNTGVNPPLVYANIEFVDIAGLVAGASKGEGLGNKFLANIREVDVILQVVRDFSDENIIREHSKDPKTDIEIINSELIIKDIESIEKQFKVKGSKSDILEKYMSHLNQGKFAIEMRDMIDKADYEEIIRPLFLLTDKEMVYVFNVDENDERLRTVDPSKAGVLSSPSIYINAKLESELASLSAEDRKAYLGDLGIKESGLDKIIKTAFEKLGLITFLTAGEKEVRAWEIKKGTNAQNASGAIHTDFVKNFIKAEVMAYEDFISTGSKLGAKDAGKLRLEGKDYIVKDGDVIEFKLGSS